VESSATRLAALRTPLRPRSSAPADRPFRVRLATAGRVSELPAPRVMAEGYALDLLTEEGRLDLQRDDAPREHDEDGDCFVVFLAGDRTEPYDAPVHRAVAYLLDSWRALPPRPGAGEAYRDLRALVVEPDETDLRAYAAAVVRVVWRMSPRFRWPRPVAPAMTPAERKAASRADRERRADVMAEWWLRTAYDEAKPGERLAAPDLWREAEPCLREHVEDYAEDRAGWEAEAALDGLPARPVLPSRNAFYRVADRLLGPRAVAHRKTPVYVVPEELLPDREVRQMREPLRAVLARLARAHEWDRP
jgi:hypothetical protein